VKQTTQLSTFPCQRSLQRVVRSREEEVDSCWTSSSSFLLLPSVCSMLTEEVSFHLRRCPDLTRLHLVLLREEGRRRPRRE